MIVAQILIQWMVISVLSIIVTSLWYFLRDNIKM